MKLYLITLAAFPFYSAESIHLAMFGKAMSKLCDFELLTPMKLWRRETWSFNLKKYYGIDVSDINQRKLLQVSPAGKSFVKRAIAIAANNGGLVYARQQVVAEEALKNSVGFVWEIHALPSAAGLKLIDSGLKAGLLKKVVVISHALKNDIVDSLGLEIAESILVAPDAADDSKFSYCTKRRGKLVVGYVGSAYPGKGAEIILPLARRCPDVEFLFYGASKNDVAIKGYGAVPDNLIFKGKVPYSEIPACFDEFDIALLPNQPKVIVANGDDIGKYTSPMKLFEYMAAGKVIIASDLDIIKEVLTHRYTALLVGHNDVDAWKQSLKEVLNDSELAGLLSVNARSEFSEKYTYSARARLIINSL
ncbi:hypothetical protein GCM10007421_19560 [Halopseudomonas oceani]|uniref:Glycosyltransferase n=1 Tax=Halopseudomonas oceani TaxID=1708783 RepID=A0A2P4EVH5_9GAMM|nr:glycosyltransferase family 4 protein [Halopseudomonas oceani]POB03579.1 hypothetical protein C1949_09405 [Halopseudomonas oceani]GGE45486.1 hypothetical protein GCM10007421_19560 [Halopseudomonas oceani]